MLQGFTKAAITKQMRCCGLRGGGGAAIVVVLLPSGSGTRAHYRLLCCLEAAVGRDLRCHFKKYQLETQF